MSADTVQQRATLSTSAFTRRYRVSVDIAAPPSAVWSLLTDADGFPAWNSTVTSITGPIQVGTRLAIRVPISERTFKPKVVEMTAPSRMCWADGQAPFFRGERTFELDGVGEGTRFTMTETFRGIMVPMAARSLPDFRPVFDAYAADLKRAAERARR